MAWDWGDSQVLGALNGGGAKNVEEGWGKTSRFFERVKATNKKTLSSEDVDFNFNNLGISNKYLKSGVYINNIYLRKGDYCLLD